MPCWHQCLVSSQFVCILQRSQKHRATRTDPTAVHGQESGWEAPVMGHESNATPILPACSPFVHASSVVVNEVTQSEDDVR